MTYEQALQALRMAIVDTPFPEPVDDGIGPHRTQFLEPYAAYNGPSVRATFYVFMARDRKPVIWSAVPGDIWRRVNAAVCGSIMRSSYWFIGVWDIRTVPYEVADWIKAERGQP